MPYLRSGLSGLGCGGGACDCGGTCGGHDHGMGLFDSMDPTTWGPGEFIVAGVGGYLAVKLAGDAAKVGSAVGKRAKRAGRGAKKAGGGLTNTIGTWVLLGGLGYGAYYLWSKSQAGGGLGDYQAQSFVNPQLLVAPNCSAQIRIPAGW